MQESPFEFVVSAEETTDQLLNRLRTVPPGSRILLRLPAEARALHELDDFNSLLQLRREHQWQVTVASPEKTVRGLSQLMGFEVERASTPAAPPPPRPSAALEEPFVSIFDQPNDDQFDFLKPFLETHGEGRTPPVRPPAVAENEWIFGSPSEAPEGPPPPAHPPWARAFDDLDEAIDAQPPTPLRTPVPGPRARAAQPELGPPKREQVFWLGGLAGLLLLAGAGLGWVVVALLRLGKQVTALQAQLVAVEQRITQLQEERPRRRRG